MVEQVVVDVVLPCEIRRERKGLARLTYLLQELRGTLGKELILRLYRKLFYETWAPVRQRQKDQDLA